MNSFITRGQAESRTQLREKFLGELLALTGDTRVMFAPKPTDTTTSIDESLTGRTLTHDATIASRLAALGLGYYTTFDGAANYSTTPDAADLSFGNSTTDSAMSFLVLANVTNTANSRTLFSRWNTSNLEYRIHIETDDTLKFNIADNSAAVGCFRASNAAITMGSFALLGGTYSGVGGASAANGMVLYQNGVAIASTATNDPSYVAMEDKTVTFDIGAINAHTNNFMQGSIALLVVCQKAMTASEMWAAKKLVNAYYALSL